ncbi:bifunctional 4-hydroxy-2-oxoglutarate aldolase/2-dehydro-3-deoxy-phosphogluconate aldolase [Reinekea sp. G2M2-21]|uniref:bifunctional 4-hydroxy-2-oxoglutarate aldolase/2-dehydro-3-deoxy-phosphogluconate aldolase n=1 Tax=Reinekea sp. G2M2-21 TaxID=2788942 RepID=UPI0018AA9024|nr:bifunctional 4-hydroxy-2-oxoglutarate aldolase/2-dehydro-3-deoxy-phosphogluconate aldolase [Reinekea sp. G2M2-21]
MSLLIDELSKHRLVPVIDLDDVHLAAWLADLLVELELPVAEVTLRSKSAIEVLGAMKTRQPSLLVGAGTVLSPQQSDEAKAAGADFMVSPGLNPKVVEAVLKNDIPMIPGVNNPSQIEQAMSLGLSAVKFFPAEASGGVGFLKAILAPYRELKVMPTGGINLSNIRSYLELPQVFACGGSWFVNKNLIESGDRYRIGEMIIQAKMLIHQIDS